MNNSKEIFQGNPTNYRKYIEQHYENMKNIFIRTAERFA
ncbi:hypothetical protein M670_01673 [Schinkia azotoformans MEV2011]|uniref:Uncharacterized protein n=1 Tax=Schinkia azotoformans MEV2011 TaxID=1348973 RepID=A0A072NPK2_SCHAZ|nr:hypothetical protein M670_01673 [Schinkia azotoformans MEV2011]